MRRPHEHTLLAIGMAGALLSLALGLSGFGPLVNLSRSVESAAVFFVESITVADLRSAYWGTTSAAPGGGGATDKVRILLVPGHEPDFGGTQFGNVYERDVAVDIADALAGYLASDSHMEVRVARSKTAWDPALQDYFDTNMASILAFRDAQAADMRAHVANGTVTIATDQVDHVTTPTRGIIKLYGINKWTAERGYDLTIHIHLNDYAGRRFGVVGKHSGFAIYVPDPQYSNARASRAVAEAVAGRISAFHATSTLPKESVGVIDDQQLIAIGSNNSADDASILIEYGYIYEPQFQTASVRPLAVDEYAYETYLGLRDFFEDSVGTRGTALLPYNWAEAAETPGAKGPDIYALQTALRSLGFYPPAGKTLSACPITGVAGPCTTTALAAYQSARSVPVTGKLTPATREALSAELLP